MFNLRIGYAWLPDAAPEAEPHLLIRLLEAVDVTGSLQQAKQTTEVSYRHAWGLIERMGLALGRPLVTKARGRGSVLTPFARTLLEADQRVRTRLADNIASATMEADRELSSLFAAPERSFRIVASHDLALARLHEHAVARRLLDFDLEFRSSRESLRALTRGEADVAGFHLRLEGSPALLVAELGGRSGPRDHAMFEFALREQGLFVAAGNPKRIRTLADLVRPRIRFVNRQPGSGSRIELDALLAEAGVDGARIRGYQHEEFTHLAVAATVATGKADAGYGIRAAGVQYGLAFVPLVTERYLLATRPETAATTSFRTLQGLLRSSSVRRWLGRLPGYRFTRSGEPVVAR
ncbi:MAG: substrate-binding domain-containing protein [Betaproteobacteria bacterium]